MHDQRTSQLCFCPFGADIQAKKFLVSSFTDNLIAGHSSLTMLSSEPLRLTHYTSFCLSIFLFLWKARSVCN